MYMKAKIVLVIGVVAVASFASVGLTDEETPPGFSVEQADIDLGTVVAGQDAVATFVFHNETEKDVKIIRAKPS